MCNLIATISKTFRNIVQDLELTTSVKQKK